MADNTEEIPKDAPWLKDWKTVAQAGGNAPSTSQEEGVVAKVARAVKPWLMEWGIIAKQANNTPTPEAVPPTPAASGPILNEAQMRKSVVIQPNERQPDTQSASSNAAEIDKELSMNPPDSVRKILIEERRKYDPTTIEPGNIDLTKRPKVKNPDGSISTVRSIGVNIDGQEVLIPTVVGNKVVSDKEAIAEYRRTGKHLGKFTSVAASNAYAERLHKDQERLYKGM